VGLYRLNRLFHPVSRRALDVAVDHGFFGEPQFLRGIERMDRVVGELVAADPDAIQLTLGQARHLQSIPGKLKPALILRVDVANVYGSLESGSRFSMHLPNAVEEAVRLDAVAICANLLDVPGQPELREATIRSLVQLRRDATRFDMPLMIEPLVMKVGGPSGYITDGDVVRIATLVRQAVELGADLIKADPSEDLDEYASVVEVAGDVPLLVRGGGRVDNRSLLERTVAVLSAGASGIVYGRNVIQHPRPAAITRALKAILHDGATVDESLVWLEETQR